MKVKLIYFFKSLCVLGCVVHSYSFFRSYFAYDVTLKTGSHVPSELRVPYLSLCFSLSSLLNATHYFFDDESIMKKLDGMSLNKVFSLGLPENEFISRCKYRDSKMNRIISATNSTECYNQLTVTKYYMLNYLCYRVMMEDYTYNFMKLVTALDGYRLLYEITINSQLNRGHRIKPIFHLSHHPIGSRNFATDVQPMPTSKFTLKLSYDYYEAKRLPAPYTTRCDDVGGKLCISDCWADAMKTFKSIYFADIIFEPSDAHLVLNRSQIINDPKIQRSINMCTKGCPLSSCDDTMILTYIDAVFVQKTRDLTFQLETIASPIKQTVTIPAFDLRQLVVMIANAFGVWLGLSVLDCFTITKSQHKVRSDVMRKHAAQIINNLQAVLISCNQLGRCVVRTNHTIPQSRSPVKSRDTKLLKQIKSSACLIINTIHRTLVLISFLVMLYMAFESYFRYSTILEYEHYSFPDLLFPRISIGVRLDTMIKTSKTSYKYPDRIDEIYQIIELNKKFRLNQLFDLSFNTSQLLDGCRVRSPDNNKLTLYSSDQCRSKLNISRFFTEHSMFYEISVAGKYDTTINTDYMNMIDNHGLLYSVIMNRYFRRFTSRFTVLVTYIGVPYTSRDFNLNIITNQREQRLFLASFARNNLEFLPPPYDTNCAPHLSDNCTALCSIERSKIVNRLPYSELIRREDIKNDNRHVVTYEDFKDPNFTQLWTKIEDECRSFCGRSPCVINFTKTVLSYKRESEHWMEFAVHLPLYPQLQAKTVPRVKLGEFVFNCACCLSFWLGVSCISIEKMFEPRDRSFHHLINLVHSIESLTHKIDGWLDAIFRRVRMKPGEHLKYLSFQTTRSKTSRTHYIKFCYALCLIGCIGHCIDSVVQYMKYPVVINNLIEIDKDLNNHSISICLNPMDILPKKLTQNKKHGYDFTPADLLNLSPSTDLVIKGCSYAANRGINKTIADTRLYKVEPNVSECLKVLSVKKFIYRGDICYSFTETYHIVRTGFSRAFNGFLLSFNIDLTDKIRNFSRFIATFTNGQVNLNSLIWSPRFEKERTVSRWYVISYIKFTYHILPANFDYSNFDCGVKIQCYQACMSILLSKFKLIADDAIMYQPVDSHYIRDGPLDMTLNVTFDELYRTCEDKCKNYEPEKETVDTFITLVGAGFRSMDKETQFYVRSSQSPVVEVFYLQMISLFDLLLQLGSMIAIWFGMAIISCNPALLFVRENWTTTFTYRQLAHLRIKIDSILKKQIVLRMAFREPERR